ncbi:DUF4870 domain-containing protein [Azotobacter salinestris]|uniref:DUF4870 domain-containing protein n=1 Tax=Azotobacter salinestris TaxID=69964 RepID=UPI001266B5C2|nr:DUF4870 domain-containing protein [Azotobacter salinestris]
MHSPLLVPLPDPQARRWAMLCHYAAFFWFLAPLVGNVLGPLIVWQLQKDRDPFVDWHGKEALNFQITYSILMMLCGALAWIFIGFPLMLLVNLTTLVLVVIAGIRANAGEAWRYPFCLRLVK